ncbi:MAG: cellulase family glycosylhydrolase [Candidatus Dormiibacterota bacterium]
MLYRLLSSPRRQRAGGVSSLSGLLGLVLAVAAVVYLPLPALAVKVDPQRPAAGTLPWLSTQDGAIVDSTGRKVLLRGFNDDALLQVGSSSSRPPLTVSDAALMQAEGFDVVRLPISWSLLEPTRGQFSQSYLKRIADLVSLCASHHLYVVLDMHTEDFGVGFGGSGAPAWLSVPGVPDLKLPFLSPAWQRHVSPAVNAALAYFWLYPNWQKLYWQAWTRVAAEFRGNSAIAGYDLYNEPHPLPVPPAIFETHLLWPFYATGIKDLARVDPNHLFIVEGDLFGDLPTAIRPLAARNLVYSTHLYSGSILPPAFKGDLAPLRAELQQGLTEAAQLPAAYWAGELGIDKNRPIAASWARAEIALSNQYLTGWAWWQWNDLAGWGVRKGPGPPDATWLDVLAQPFVRAAPGTLTGLRYDVKTKTLAATVNDPGSDRSVMVSWPASVGTPRSLSSCAQIESPYLPASGELTLKISSASCQIELRG